MGRCLPVESAADRAPRTTRAGCAWDPPPPWTGTEHPLISVVIVEDNWVWASAVQAQIDTQPGMRHVGTTDSVDDALAIVASQRVDVALVDLLLKADSGLRFARSVHARRLSVRTVLMSIEPNAWAVNQAKMADVAGFIHKEDLETGAQIVAILRAVANGRRVFTQRAIAPAVDPAAASAKLSPQEMEIVRCLQRGMDTPAIAGHLSLGQQTVRNKISGIGSKLGVRGRVEILAWHATGGLGLTPRR